MIGTIRRLPNGEQFVGELAGTVRRRGGPFEHLVHHFADGGLDDGDEQLVLGAEVLVYGLLGHSGRGGDVVHARAGVPLAQELSDRGLADLPAFPVGSLFRVLGLGRLQGAQRGWPPGVVTGWAGCGHQASDQGISSDGTVSYFTRRIGT
jgi:hypothetical protein